MRAGVRVFPCREWGASIKAPYVNRGFKEATTDILIGEGWAQKFPIAVMGIPCAINNVLVIDADRHDKGDGVANLLALFARYEFDWRSVPTVATPNDGYHFYFNRPTGMGHTKASLCEAVDVRDNAYVIAPDCQMGDGRWYRLVEGSLTQFAEAIAARLLPDPPEWMIPMLVHPSAPKRGNTTRSVAVDDESLKNQIRGLLTAVLQAEEGNRNSLLFWAACRLAEMIGADLVSYELAEALLERAGDELGLSAREIRSTIMSGLRKAWEGNDHAR